MRTLLSPMFLVLLLVTLAPGALAQRAADCRTGIVQPSSYRSSQGYASSRIWVPGHHEIVCERVWVPGRLERTWVEAVFELRRDACGNTVRVLLVPGHWRTIRHSGHFELRRTRVWQPGCWQARGGCS